MDNGKNKGSDGFNDETFDDDFVDTDFDEAAFDDDTAYDDLPADDADYEGDDFEVEDWGDAEEENTSKKPRKSKGGGGGLSFNAIVITGAVVVGAGVLGFNVLKETGKAQSAQTSVFQSILNIGGIMDGTLFGEKEEETVSATPDGVPQNEGFLNDPSQTIPLADSGVNPPQPMPIAPADPAVAENEPLTPMPDMPVTPSAEAPRGPNDMPPVAENTQAVDAVPAPEASPSAEDILKQAMASREQKKQEEEPVESAVDGTQEQSADASEKIEEVASEAKQEIAEAVAPVAEKVEQAVEQMVAKTPSTPEAVPAPEPAPAAPVVAELPEETKQEITANKEAVSAVESKLDVLLKRMDQIEGELGTIRSGKNTDTQDLEKTVAALREEIAQIKSRPAGQATPSRQASQEPAASDAPKPARKVKKPVQKTQDDEAYSPARTTASPSSPAPAPRQTEAKNSQGGWELRAAQPGRAWVSKSGAHDMQAVAVGDTLPGVGRISAITYMNGRWTVTGTQGSIHQ